MVIDNTASTRRNTIRAALAALSIKGGKDGRGLSAQDHDLIGRYEIELAELDRQHGTALDARHAAAFTQFIRRDAQAFTTEQWAAMEEGQLVGTRMHYRNGQLVSARPQYRATAGVEGTPSGGAYPGSTAGFAAPLPFLKQVFSAAKYTAPWLDIADVHVTVTGAPIVFPADNDIGTAAAQLNEGAADSTNDVTLVNTALGSYRWSSGIVKVSNEMLQDTGIDIDEYLAGRFAARMMRGLDPKFTKGAGTTEPLGLLTGLTASVTATGSSDTDGSGGANTCGLSDLVALEKACDPAYRKNARFLMNANTLASLRNVKDSNKRPVFQSLNRTEGPVLLGYPVAIAPAMDSLQANASSPAVTKVPIAFGDTSYFKIRFVQPTMIRLSTLYAASFQTGFLLIWRVDSALVDGASSNRAVVTLQTTY